MFQSSMGLSETADFMVKLLISKILEAAVIYLGYTKQSQCTYYCNQLMLCLVTEV